MVQASEGRKHQFVPNDIDAKDVEAISALYDKLDAQDVSTKEALENFILDWEELQGVLGEEYARSYVDMSSYTTNSDYEARYINYIEKLIPLSEPRNFAIKQKIMASPAVGELGSNYEVLLRNIKSEVDLFREENVPLTTEELKLTQEYEKITGSEQAEFRGEMLTLTQLRAKLDDPDRSVREEAWRARARAQLNDASTLDAIFDKLYDIRQTVARNAGFANYRDYKFAEYKRFDYTPEDCTRFHEAIEKHVVPFMERQNERRKSLLGLDALRPWDVDVDPEDNKVIRPYDTLDELQNTTHNIVSRVDEELGGFFKTMMSEDLLDLENRPGKSPGAYCTAFPDSKVPFIFANSVNNKRDVDTLLHEGGHAFHYFLSRDLPLQSYHFAGAEFSEVASMSMELLARPYLSEFYSDEELGRLLDEQLRGSLKILPWIAMLDSFQHWVYTTEDDHGPEARRAKWLEIDARFRPGIDWSGLEKNRGIGWQYLHVFQYPFYYVEYGIAQLGALQIWLRSLKDYKGAVEAYKRALSLGGSRPLPELFNAADLRFAMDDEVVGMVTRQTEAEIKG